MTEIHWRRHSHSYSEGELSKSAAVGTRTSSRGHEGHRCKFKFGNQSLIWISIASTGGSGGYHSAGSRGTSQVKLTFLACLDEIKNKPLKGGRGSGESRKSGHSGESDAGVVRQANVFIRWEGFYRNLP